MAQNSLIQVRVDNEIKEMADTLFSHLGLDTPTAIRMFLRQAIMNDGLPFDVRCVPNRETLQALEDSKTGRNLIGPFDNVDDMMASLLED